MMGIGFPELMIILVIIMIIFGAGKLPEIGNAFGKSIKNFKQSMKEANEEDEAVTAGEEAVAEGEEAKPAEQLEENLSDEEKELLARKKAEEEGEAKDQAMRDKADAFTASLPRTGSYDYAKDEANKKA